MRFDLEPSCASCALSLLIRINKIGCGLGLEFVVSKRAKLAWNNVFACWKDFNVPALDIVPFNKYKHYARQPWVAKPGYGQYVTSNPQFVTARHLCDGVVTSSPEAFCAFAIHAFIKEERSKYLPEIDDLWRICWSKLQAIDNRPGPYWNANSRYVLPHTDDCRSRFDPASWQECVGQAAEQWISIVSHYTLVRIPDFMDYESDEYEEWRKHLAQDNERRERAEYERLRRKYGSL